jgi:hypothetical protein
MPSSQRHDGEDEMRIVDRTPFKSPDGQISAVDRVRAMAKYGSKWYSDIQAQDATAALLGRQLGSGYILLVNPPLPGTDVLLPLVLVGPVGVFLINITNERGVFSARGEEWGTLTGERFTPAKVNLLTRTARMAEALQKFLEKQGFALLVEPVLLAMNPGMHVESVRPIIRVVMSDAVERFAIGLAQATRTLSIESASLISERILKPRAPKKEGAGSAPALAAVETGTAPEVPAYMPQGYGDQPGASGQPEGQAEGPLTAETLGFSFTEEPEPDAAPPKPKPAQAAPAKKPAKVAPAGAGGVRFSRGQWTALGCLLLLFILVLVAFIVLAAMNA